MGLQTHHISITAAFAAPSFACQSNFRRLDGHGPGKELESELLLVFHSLLVIVP